MIGGATDFWYTYTMGILNSENIIKQTQQSKRSASLIENAGLWCLKFFGLPAETIKIRPANAGDDAALQAMERRAFPMFSAPQTPWERGFYKASSAQSTAFGYFLRVVAEHNGDLSGYTLLQIRNWGEVYAYETAARPKSPQYALRVCAPILIGVAARIAQIIGADSVTANVRGMGGLSGYNYKKIIAHCARHGLLPTEHAGILYDGQMCGQDDIWLRGDPEAILENVRVRTLTFAGTNRFKFNTTALE